MLSATNTEYTVRYDAVRTDIPVQGNIIMLPVVLCGPCDCV